MASKEEFEFLNSKIWLDYTQKRYVSLEDIKYRLDHLGISKSKWPEVKQKILRSRKMGAIPFFLKTLDKNFWYFPSDSIIKKIHKVETKGNELYEKIDSHASFKRDFLENATVEEAVTSALYEGVNSTRSKAKALIALKEGPQNKDEWMLINNYRAMMWIKEHSTLPVSNELIQKIHQIITQNTLEGDDGNFCGKFRDNKVYIGEHEGVEHGKIEGALKEAIKLTTGHPRFIHSLIKSILLHYFISYIHPFFDGNGRTARTLFYFKAIKDELKFLEILSISASLKDHGKKYEKSFELVKDHDWDLTFLIDFSLDALIYALKEVEKKINYLIDISKLMKGLGLNKKQIILIQRMALNKHKKDNNRRVCNDD